MQANNLVNDHSRGISRRTLIARFGSKKSCQGSQHRSEIRVQLSEQRKIIGRFLCFEEIDFIHHLHSGRGSSTSQ